MCTIYRCGEGIRLAEITEKVKVLFKHD
jgi:hypothetical protein